LLLLFREDALIDTRQSTPQKDERLIGVAPLREVRSFDGDTVEVYARHTSQNIAQVKRRITPIVQYPAWVWQLELFVNSKG
jgi:hypothetical protein